ncbi:MAG: SDR family NAD(P)-dependent oxidoreductase [Chloroflexota bacterium]|nr:SDR family NAD(P)-dependent oxidoreductase [Chloroflexota bacterium]
MFDLTGHTALVTGAGQGMGAGVAHALAAQGARVAVNDYHLERADRTAASIRDLSGTAIGIQTDVTDPASIAVMIVEIERQFGPVDILVNNAGIPVEGVKYAKFIETEREDMEVYIDLNLRGVMNCVRAVLPGMCERGWGRIVTVSSESWRLGVNMGLSLYATSKAGAVGFMRQLSGEIGSSGVTANCISLGMMNNAPNADAICKKATSVGRAGTPEDVGAAVVYLASEEAAWVTGQVLPLNGGSCTA